MSKNSSRRAFMGKSAAIGAGYFIGNGYVNLNAQDTPLQSLTAACIGVGGKGESDSSHLAGLGVKIAAICDVDKASLTKRARDEAFKDAEQFTDYRELLDKIGSKVDLVSISIPDHSHTAAAVKAMKMKKHVYVQKPLTWSIREARVMRETAEKMGVVTQMGNQGTSQDGLRKAVEVVQSGAIGDVKEVHIWSNRPIWPQGAGRPEGSDPIPEGLNWDAWIGPAPMRPYKGARTYHDFNWRGWVDFGTGALGDMACHTTNLAVKAVELWDPIAVTAVKNSGIVDNEQYPKASMLKFEYPKRNGLVACDFYWYDGGNLPNDEILKLLPQAEQGRLAQQKANPGARGRSGALLVGTKGSLFSPDDYGGQYILLPEENFKDFKAPDQTIPRIPFNGQMDQRQKWEFVNSIKGDYKPGTMSNFGYAGRLTETMLVGILALRSGEGKRIEWDAKNLVSTNMPEMNKFVHREYRDGWSLT